MSGEETAKMEELIKKAVRDVIREERDEFWISQPQHYMDHQFMATCQKQKEEWVKNHEFVSGVRSGAEWGKKIGITVGVTAFLTFLAGAVWLAIKVAVMGDSKP